MKSGSRERRQCSVRVLAVVLVEEVVVVVEVEEVAVVVEVPQFLGAAG